MGAQTRQIRAVYRESATFRVGKSDTTQLVSTFIFTAGLAAALLAGSTRFDHNSAMQEWLRFGSVLVLVLGCVGIGAKLVSTGLEEIRQLDNPTETTITMPLHLRPSRRHSTMRVAIGVVVGAVIPVGVMIASAI